MLGLHAMISGDDDGRPKRIKLGQIAIKHLIKSIGLRGAPGADLC